MPWFKVDDGFWAHPKTLGLSPAAVSLWVRAGSWASQQLTDGLIATHVLPVFATPSSVADELVEVGYWHEVEGGWEFHDWNHYQPSAAETKSKREEVSRKRSEAGRKGAESRWHNAKQTDGKAHGKLPLANDGNDIAPSRPVPSPTSSTKKSAYSPEFEEFWALYPRKQAKRDAQKAFNDAVKDGATQKQLIAGAQAYALLNITEDKSFLKLPGGWLRGERWEDEQIVNATKTTSTGQPVECGFHPGYPLPCDKCEREGRRF